MLLENEEDIILFLNIESKKLLDKLKYDFKIPEMLKHNPEKENKSVTEENIIFEDEGGNIFTPVLGIVSSPTRTNSVELKKRIMG